MGTERRNAVITTALAAAALAAATAYAQASSPPTQRLLRSQASPPSPTEHACSPIDEAALRELFAGATDYSDYPGGATGTSNGHARTKNGQSPGPTGTSGG